MRTRHRIPMIFSLSMMDVFCCALGCVILLWLIYQREAMLRARAAATATEQLTSTQASLADLIRLRDELQRKLDAAAVESAALRSQVAELRGDVASARSRADQLLERLAAERDRAADAEDRLAKMSLAEQQLSRQRTEAMTRVAELERQVQEREAAAQSLTRSTTELTERLTAAEARITQLKRQADLLPEVRDAAVASDARVKTLERELSEMRSTLDAARSEARDLTQQLTRARGAAEHRFEGIALSGRRVVVLLDISGSMELVDEKTKDPGKWPAVRDTLVRILRSLPNLEQFQIILFSDTTTHLLGSEGRWIDYDANSAMKVSEALAAVRPRGNTNLYAAFEAAFRYRPLGLDTIYLLSDGLPNVGEGLTPAAASGLSETQRTERLSRAVRAALKSRWNALEPDRPRVRIHSVGFFYESPEVGAFLWALSRENDGSFVGMRQ